MVKTLRLPPMVNDQLGSAQCESVVQFLVGSQFGDEGTRLDPDLHHQRLVSGGGRHNHVGTFDRLPIVSDSAALYTQPGSLSHQALARFGVDVHSTDFLQVEHPVERLEAGPGLGTTADEGHHA